MRDWASKSSSEGEDILRDVTQSTQKGKVIAFGKDECPAGPLINSSKDIIIVEGRADVLNLMRAGIENTIAVEGTSVPPTIVELAKTKNLSAFLDGDRGGDLILRELNSVVKLTKVSRAPRGKEVEDLTPVEILENLDKKPEKDWNKKPENGFKGRGFPRRREYSNRSYSRDKESYTRDKESYSRDRQEKEYSKIEEFPDELVTKAKEIIPDLEGSLEAHIYDSNIKEILKIPVNELVKTLETTDNSEHIVFDGIITQRLIEVAESNKVKTLIANRIGNISSESNSLKMISFDKIR